MTERTPLAQAGARFTTPEQVSDPGPVVFLVENHTEYIGPICWRCVAAILTGPATRDPFTVGLIVRLQVAPRTALRCGRCDTLVGDPDGRILPPDGY